MASVDGSHIVENAAVPFPSTRLYFHLFIQSSENATIRNNFPYATNEPKRE